MNRWFALALAILGLAFLSRVAGQFIQVIAPMEFLPPLESWQGSNLPYPALLAAQIGILVMIAWISARMATGRRALPRRFAKPVIALGAVYFGVMAVRLVLGLTALADVKWFASPIPTGFHLVLATAVMITGAYGRAVEVKQESSAAAGHLSPAGGRVRYFSTDFNDNRRARKSIHVHHTLRRHRPYVCPDSRWR